MTKKYLWTTELASMEIIWNSVVYNIEDFATLQIERAGLHDVESGKIHTNEIQLLAVNQLDKETEVFGSLLMPTLEVKCKDGYYKGIWNKDHYDFIPYTLDEG